MKILQNAGTFEILDSKRDLRKKTKHIEKAGRTCYQSERKRITMRTASLFSKMLMSVEHFPMIEMVDVTVKFYNVSRGFTHELVRHRLASYGQKSTRYVKEKNPEFIFPPHKDPKNTFVEINGKCYAINEILEMYEATYAQLVTKKDKGGMGWFPEDARQFLPIGISNEIVMKANLTEWRHVFLLRTSERAHWEIRGIMLKVLREFTKLFPTIFSDIVVVGSCKKGYPYTNEIINVNKLTKQIEETWKFLDQNSQKKILQTLADAHM